MTEAGWTRKKPTVAGWYWWRGKEESGIALVFPAYKPMPWHTSDPSARVQLFYSAGGMSSTRVNDFGGEWLGPISPTDRQQGRVEGLRDSMDDLRKRMDRDDGDTDNDVWKHLAWCELQIKAQAAQDEKPTKEGL